MRVHLCSQENLQSYYRKELRKKSARDPPQVVLISAATPMVYKQFGRADMYFEIIFIAVYCKGVCSVSLNFNCISAATFNCSNRLNSKIITVIMISGEFCNNKYLIFGGSIKISDFEIHCLLKINFK